MPASVASASSAAGWLASLSLGYCRQGERTVLARRAHRGPLVVQRPFYPEGAVCHSYLLHPPGGIVGGDRLNITVEVEAGAHALITTPGAGKCYRSDGREAQITQTLRVVGAGALEWLPQEMLLFDATRIDTTTRVELEHGARFIGWEITCLGRPASGERYTQGQCRQRLEVWRDGHPLLLERATLAGGHRLLQAPWGLAGRSVTATLLAIGADESVVLAARDAARAAVQMTGDDAGAVERPGNEHMDSNSAESTTLVSITVLDDLLVCRCLGQGAQHVRRQLERVWQAIRPLVMTRAACMPRIWQT